MERDFSVNKAQACFQFQHHERASAEAGKMPNVFILAWLGVSSVFCLQKKANAHVLALPSPRVTTSVTSPFPGRDQGRVLKATAQRMLLLGRTWGSWMSTFVMGVVSSPFPAAELLPRIGSNFKPSRNQKCTSWQTLFVSAKEKQCSAGCRKWAPDLLVRWRRHGVSAQRCEQFPKQDDGDDYRLIGAQYLHLRNQPDSEPCQSLGEHCSSLRTFRRLGFILGHRGKRLILQSISNTAHLHAHCQCSFSPSPFCSPCRTRSSPDLREGAIFSRADVPLCQRGTD